MFVNNSSVDIFSLRYSYRPFNDSVSSTSFQMTDILTLFYILILTFYASLWYVFIKSVMNSGHYQPFMSS